MSRPRRRSVPPFKLTPRARPSAFWPASSASSTYRSRPATCPHCGYVVDAHDSLDGGGPNDCAVSFCLRCGRVSMYVVTGSTFELRLPTDDELGGVLAEPSYQSLRAAWLAAYGPAGPVTHQDDAARSERLRETEND